MAYAKEFYEDYLKPKGIFSFTHKDILKYTDANCSYSVIRELKSFLVGIGLKLQETEEKRTNKKNQTKKYKRYWIEAI